MDIANLIIRVTNEGLDRATRELRRLQDQASGAQSANERFGKSIADLNRLALVGFGALTAVVGGSIKTAIDFEKAMAGVAKTVDFAADNGLANMKKGIEDLTKTIPLAFEELAEIAAVGGQLGVAEQDILGFTETIAKMGVAFDLPAEQAADSMAKIANGFNIPIAQVGTLGDTINAVSNSMAATAGDVINFMGRVSGSSAALKISADNVAALGGAMAALNMQPEIAATAFNSLSVTLAKFDNLSKSQKSGFAKLGLDTKEFAETIKTDGLGAIMQVLEASKELGGTDAIAALNLAFGESGTKLATMAEGMDTVKFALDQVGVGADGVSKTLGSMESEFQSVSATTANKLELTKNNMRLVAAAVGEAFLPAVNDLVESLVPMIEKLNTWASANPELIVTIAKVVAVVTGAIIAIAGVSSAIGVALGAFQGVAAIVGVAITVFKALLSPIILIQSAIAHLWPVFVALTSPIGLAVLAIAALIAIGVALYMNWDLIKQKATEIWGAITSYISNKINEIKNYFSTNFPAMTAIVSSSIEIIKTLFVGGFNLIKNTVTTVLGVIKAVITGDFKAIPGIIGDGLKTAAGIVTNMMGNILNIIKEYGKKLYSIGKDFIQGFINGIKSVGSGVASAASTMVGNAIAAVKKRQDSASPSKVTTKLGGDFAKGMENGIKKGAKAVKSEAQKMAEQAIKAVEDGIAGFQKRIALFGDNSELSSLLYDIDVGKFKGASQARIDEWVKQATALQNLESQLKATNSVQARFDKWQDERDAMRKKATGLITDRFAQFNSDKASSSDNLQGMLGGIEQESPLGKIQADYEARLELIEQYENTHTDMLETAKEARLAVEQSYMDAKRDLMLTQGEALFGDLSDLAKGFAGEQSGIYKALFLVEKGFAIAQSAIAIQASIAKAMAVGFPANIPIIGQAVSQGMGIMSSIKGITAGFKQGGYTGNMGASQVAGVVHGQEYVFDAQATKRIGVDNLNAMRRGDKVGGDVNITVNNMSSARVETQKDDNGNIIMTIREEVKKSWGSLSNPNSFESKQVNRNVQAPRRR